MTATTAYLGSGAAAVRRAPGRWIQAAPFDLAFFVLSPLLGLAVVLASGGDANAVAAVAATMLLGFPHYLSTFVFYFWDDNRAHHAARSLAFFGVPLAIVAATLTVTVLHVPYVIAVVTYFWNCFHVSLQSCGIASLYRHQGGGAAAADKTSANAAIIATNLWFVLWNTESYPALQRFLTIPGPEFPRVLWAATGVLAVAACLRLLWSLVARARAGAPPRSPELMLLATSIVMFHPYLWLEANLATTGMLTGHFVQYLGIVWLLHRRKFGRGAESGAPGWLRWISSSTPALVAAILAVALTMFVAWMSFRAVSRESWFLTMSISLIFVHFYLDGLFWAFRNPHVRRTIGAHFAPRAAA